MEDYLQTLAELEACLDYLFCLRWPNGFLCPSCGHTKGWQVRNTLIQCAVCSHQTSVTAGTIFHGTRKPLTTWFRTIWWVTSQKTGASALGLQRILGLGSYETAWAWLHKLRRAMVRPDRDRLSGKVEVDETYVGGEKPGKRGRGALEKSLEEAVQQAAVPGSVICTDGWKGYCRLNSLGYTHEVVRHTEEVGDKLLPHCHRVAALLKRWMEGGYRIRVPLIMSIWIITSTSPRFGLIVGLRVTVVNYSIGFSNKLLPWIQFLTVS